MAKGAKGLILDVRNNPGGFTDAVIKMVDYLVQDNIVPEGGDSKKPGLLLEMRDKEGKILYGMDELLFTKLFFLWVFSFGESVGINQHFGSNEEIHTIAFVVKMLKNTKRNVAFRL